MTTNYFNELNSIDLTDKIEKKNGLSYVSWSFAWQEIKKRFPNAQYTIYENSNGLFYHTDGKTCWVKTGVTVNDIEHIEYLPVMNFRNQSIPVDTVTSMDVNKAIQRSLTKACARHGLGLYVYAGEELPEGDNEEEKPKQKPQPAKPKSATTMPKTETVKLIGQEEKDTLKTVLGLPRYAQEMNKCGGKMSVETYQNLLIESEK